MTFHTILAEISNTFLMCSLVELLPLQRFSGYN